jgi:poly(3-hydroxybutyrate) depolymerase
VITVDDVELADPAADDEVLPLLLLLPLLHAAAASSATASGAASLTGTGTLASKEAFIVIIPLARRWAVCRCRSVRLSCAN